MFSSAYSYIQGMPTWSTSTGRYDDAGKSSSGKIYIWQNWAMSMLPLNPAAIESGNGTIRFTSQDQAEMTFEFFLPVQTGPIQVTF